MCLRSPDSMSGRHTLSQSRLLAHVLKKGALGARPLPSSRATGRLLLMAVSPSLPLTAAHREPRWPEPAGRQEGAGFAHLSGCGQHRGKLLSIAYNM